MWKWIGKLWQRDLAAPPQRSEAEAKSYLNSLRENELSVGAAMRCGEHVTRALGQTRAAAATSGPALTPQNLHSGVANPVKQADAADSGEDFGTSLAIGMATGSGAVGYVAGGALAGGFIGAAMSGVSDYSAAPRTPGE